MDQDWPLYMAVIIGSIVLGSVLWNYLWRVAEQKLVLSVSLSLIGFTLVSSPLWGSIVVHGPQFEITLLQKQVVSQSDAYLELVELYKKRLPPQLATEVAPSIDELRASVRDLKLATNMKKIDETVKVTDKLTLKVKKLHP